MHERTLYLAEAWMDGGLHEQILHTTPEDAKEDIAVAAGFDESNVDWTKKGDVHRSDHGSGDTTLVVKPERLYRGEDRGTPYDLATVLRTIDGVVEVRASHHDLVVAFAADRHDTVEDIDDDTLDAVERVLEPTVFELAWDGGLHDGLERHDHAGDHSHDPLASPHACDHELHARYFNTMVTY